MERIAEFEGKFEALLHLKSHFYSAIEQLENEYAPLDNSGIDSAPQAEETHISESKARTRYEENGKEENF